MKCRVHYLPGVRRKQRLVSFVLGYLPAGIIPSSRTLLIRPSLSNAIRREIPGPLVERRTLSRRALSRVKISRPANNVSSFPSFSLPLSRPLSLLRAETLFTRNEALFMVPGCTTANKNLSILCAYLKIRGLLAVC